VRANQHDGGVHLDHGQPRAGCRDRVTLARVRLSRACNTSSSTWKVRQLTILGAPSLSLMKSVIVLSVSTWGAVSFPEIAFDLAVSRHMLRHRLSFPRGGEIAVRQDLLLAMLRAPCGRTRAAPV